jgi:outer membrane protein insertion porin family
MAEARMFLQFGRRRSLLLAVCGIFAFASMMGLRRHQVEPSGALAAREPPAPAGQPASQIKPEGRVIDRVVFEGLSTVDLAFAQSTARITPGSIWDRNEIAAACARLAATGKFEGSPYAEPREEDGKLVLVFVVHERPYVQQIDFVGNKKFKTSDLLKETELAIGAPISDFTINQAKQEVERKYREAGYYHVTIDVDEQVLREEQRVLFRISEGPRIKVRHINFEGNTAYSARVLRSKIETSTYIWIFRTGAFSDEVAQRDAAALKKYYSDRGYLNARVGYRIEFPDPNNESSLTLIFQIEEGLQHIIKSIEFSGDTVFDADHLASLMKSAIGKPIDADVMETDRQGILAEYGSIGYIYSEVTTPYTFDVEDGFVNLKVQVKEEGQYRLGRIDIRGNRMTKDKVIRRELRFFPEQLYNNQETKKAEKRLVETGLFSEATITPQGETPGVRDALVDVAEANTTNILFGVGVTSNSGLVGSITLEQKNFDLFDWPRDSKEFFKGRSFKGAGQTLRLTLEPGTELTRGRIEFREPFLLDQDVGFGLGAYLFERDRDEYDEERIGFYTSFDKRFREGILKDWSAEAAFKFEHIDISGVKWNSADEIKDVQGGSWLTSVKGTIVRDKTDSRWLPSEGNRLQVAWEQFGALGGDYTFSKLTGNFDQYWTVSRDVFDRKHIVAAGGMIGQIFGDAPVFEKFYGGGIGSIRGFEYRGISPRAGMREDRVGGDFTLLTNVEYSFPLFGKVLRGVTFLDMGTVEDDFGLSSWRSAVGVGVRLYIQYFGSIPLSFDLAFPTTKDSEDDTQIFSFSFGTTF